MILIIVSFVIFLAALAFVFIYINPFAKATSTNNNIDSIENIILKNISINVGKLSVISNDSLNGCYNIADFNVSIFLFVI